MIQLISVIVQYRELIVELAMRDLRVRYKRSMLGFFWALLHPLLLMIVLVIVFSSIFGTIIEQYPIYLITGLFPMTFFTQILSYCVSSIEENATLIKRISVPKAVFPVAAVLGNLINFLLSMIPLALLVLVLGWPLHWTWIFLPVPIICLIMFGLGVGFFFAAANVFFRDIAHIVQIVIAAWFYFSPVIWTLDFIDPKYHLIVKLNPLFFILDGFHNAIYFGSIPSFTYTAISVGSGFVALLLGYRFFRRLQDLFINYL
jgi:ABC-2 type transport system permease protein